VIKMIYEMLYVMVVVAFLAILIYLMYEQRKIAEQRKKIYEKMMKLNEEFLDFQKEANKHISDVVEEMLKDV